MKKLLAYSFLIFLVGACINPDAGHRKEQKEDGTTNESSKLFFKNVRSYYYKDLQKNDSKTQILRHKNFEPDSTRPQLEITIANMWMQDRAILYIRPNKYFPDQDSLVFKSGNERFVWKRSANHVYFANEVFENLNDDNDLYYNPENGKKVKVFSTKKEEEIFTTTVKDYLRLIHLR